jgi:hypothetical protein
VNSKPIVEFAKKVGIVCGAVIAAITVLRLMQPLAVSISKPIITAAVAEGFRQEEEKLSSYRYESELRDSIQTVAIVEIRNELHLLNATANEIKRGRR